MKVRHPIQLTTTLIVIAFCEIVFIFTGEYGIAKGVGVFIGLAIPGIWMVHFSKYGDEVIWKNGNIIEKENT